jgi:hypothetical protein
MRIHIDVTLEVPPDSLAALRALAEAFSTGDAAWFVRDEAEDQIKGYLSDNGVRVRTIQRSGVRVDEGFVW